MGSIKPVLLLLLLDCLLQGIPVYCQSPSSFTLTENDASLDKVLTDIRNKYGYTAYGEGDWPSLAHHLTFIVKEVSIRQLLDRCFENQPLSYKLMGTAILINIRPLKDTWVHGYVFNEKKEPLPGTTISLQSGSPSDATMSKEDGEFRIHIHYADTRLIVSNVNYETQELSPEEGKDLTVLLKERFIELADVSVTALSMHTGYQEVKNETATGSFSKVNNDLLNRSVGPNVLIRMDGVTSSVIFNKNVVQGSNTSAISVRGRSTIFGNPDPLIVIDNFPYTGDINNINPDDVESITVLKDAAAASIWGAFSGNGVIVITTKKGKYGQAPKLTFNTSMTVGKRLNLYYPPALSSSDYIDVEQFLFGKGFYIPAINNGQHQALSPAVEILIKQNQGLPPAEAQAQLNVLRGQDTRQDLDKYFFRPSFNQQYSLSLTGGSLKNQYYFSAGYDRDLSNLVRNQYDRITLNGNNTYCLIPGKLELSTGLAFTASTTDANNIGGIIPRYPYLKLADAKGNALPVAYQLRGAYVDTVGGGQLLDWHYRPLDELRNADNSTQLTDYRINIGLRYMILKKLNAHIYYQYGRGNADFQNYQSQQTYFTRNLINEFTQGYPTGTLTRPVPLGGILDETVTSYVANNVRGQLNYDDSSFLGGVLNAIGGAELRNVEGDIRATRLYGYTNGEASTVAVDYVDLFPQYTSGQLTQIPYNDQKMGTSDRFISYYSNAAYTYRRRYILSASLRRDESNLFGVKANQKGVPLWSVGGAWEIAKEKFYHLKWLPFLKLRVTNGYNGNVDRSVSAFTTANINPINNTYGAIVNAIINPPNPSLRWERINIFNTGIDFASKGDRIGGSIEYYIKTGKDLIGQIPVDPTTGVFQFTGNTANMRANGWDISLHTNATIGPVRWNSTLLFSYVLDKVTDYTEKLGGVVNYFSPSTVNPLVGHPLYSVYALRWMGLDPMNGDPQGFLNGKVSKDYSGILNSSDLTNLVYKGPANPPYFGSWRNSFYWRQWGFSFNILYKFGYVFRRNSINYATLFNGASPGHSDYERRWQKTGDEKTTYVPSMIYPDPTSPTRDNFYQYSEPLIEKGDHVRLQDLQLSYDLTRKMAPWMPMASVRFYCYANNIGILWKANHQGIDPDYVNVSLIPNPRTLALGLKMEF